MSDVNGVEDFIISYTIVYDENYLSRFRKTWEQNLKLSQGIK